MIRGYQATDFIRINEIGSQIKDNFNEQYDIEKITDYDWLNIYVYEENNDILGFIEVAKNYDNIDIYAIAVDTKYQRQNIASKLIQYIKDNFDIETITLEVRSNNQSAINLYQKNGFSIINIRKNYYENDDALVMQYNSKEVIK